MLVVFKTFVINLENVHSFWIADEVDTGKEVEKGFFIKFSDRHGHKIMDDEILCVPFKSVESRAKAYREILFSYQEGKKVLAVIEEKEKEELEEKQTEEKAE